MPTIPLLSACEAGSGSEYPNDGGSGYDEDARGDDGMTDATGESSGDGTTGDGNTGDGNTSGDSKTTGDTDDSGTTGDSGTTDGDTDDGDIDDGNTDDGETDDSGSGDGMTGDSDTGDGDSDDSGSDDGGPVGPESMFSHGVASGDPLVDSVILWTRVSPEVEEGSVTVDLEVARDADFQDVVGQRSLETDESRDYTVKVDVDGLDAATTYYYRFTSHQRTSPVGRTRTAPRGSVTHLRFAVCSCSNHAYGYFHPYQAIAERADLDAVLHLGDYIYEYATGEYGDARSCEPETETITLDDYRTRFSQYRRDPGLQAAHQQHPFVTVWDDHESANNAWTGGAENHTEGSEGTWTDRLAAARQAYEEWMPIRSGMSGLIYRRISYGNLLDIIMLDTRIAGRDQEDSANRDDPNRSLLGFEQEAWLEDELISSTTTWRFLGQQVMMGQLALGSSSSILNPDQWDGYRAARNRLYTFIRDQEIDNVVVLTGDIHSSWANDLVEDPWDSELYDPGTGLGSLAVEFVAPAITSPGLSLGSSTVTSLNPHVKWVDTSMRGYIVLDVTPEQVQADWFHYSAASIESPNGSPADEMSGTSWRVLAGEPQVSAAPRTARGKRNPPALAPW